MKTMTHLAALLCIAAILTGCGSFGKPQAWAVIAGHDHDSGGSIASDIVAYTTTDAFASQLGAHAALTHDAAKQVRVQKYRDTSLLKVSALSSSDRNALALVSASIAVIREHFDALVKKKHADAIRRDTSKSEEQKTIEIAIIEKLPRSSIEIVEPPRIAE